MQESKLSKKGQLRCKKLHKVGLEMFLKHGYQKTSLNDVVKVAGGSLSTVYKHYGSKEGFFEQVIFDGVEEFFEQVESKISLQKNLGIEEFLFQFGRLYIETFETKKSIGIGRIIYRGGYKNNGTIAKNFRSKIDAIIHKIFHDFFDKKEMKEKLRCDDVETLANTFCLLVREPEFTSSIITNSVTKLSDKQKDKKIQNVVNLFLHGFLKK